MQPLDAPLNRHLYKNVIFTVLSSFVSYQVLNYLLDAFLGSLHAVLGSLQRDPLTVSSCAREANGYTAVLLRQLPQHLTSPTHKVPVVANVYYHAVLHHVILEELSSFFLPFAPKSKLNHVFVITLPTNSITRFFTRLSSSIWA